MPEQPSVPPRHRDHRTTVIGSTRMPRRSAAATAAVALAAFSAPAHAQHVPAWVAAALLSPILVLLLCVVLGLVTRSARTGARHAGLVLIWIVLFALASYFVENDYAIWTPLALYVAHAALLLALIAVGAAKRVGRRGHG